MTSSVTSLPSMTYAVPADPAMQLHTTRTQRQTGTPLAVFPPPLGRLEGFVAILNKRTQPRCSGQIVGVLSEQFPDRHDVTNSPRSSTRYCPAAHRSSSPNVNA
jgi:hypothetical protein